MVDKNPYEKDDVNVPNFGDAEDKGNEPIFNMDTTSVVPETDSFDIEEEAESSSKAAIIVLVVFLVLFLVGAVSGWLFGISKSREVTKAYEEYDAYKAKTQKQITDLETQVSTLQAQIAQNSSSSSESSSSEPGEKTEANTYYLMDQGISVRNSAGSTEFADYSKLPNDIKDLVFQDGKKITTRNVKFPVSETKEVGGNIWGKIADNAWVCIKYGSEEWGKKQ